MRSQGAGGVGAAPLVLEPAEHDLDAVAAFVSPLVVFDYCLALPSTWAASAYFFVFKWLYKPIGVVSAIPEQPINLWQVAQLCPRIDVITDLACSDE